MCPELGQAGRHPTLALCREPGALRPFQRLKTAQWRGRCWGGNICPPILVSVSLRPRHHQILIFPTLIFTKLPRGCADGISVIMLS